VIDWRRWQERIQEHYIISALCLVLVGVLLLYAAFFVAEKIMTTLGATLIATGIALFILSFSVEGIETKILRELGQGELSLKDFYENRSQLPAWNSEKWNQTSEFWFAWLSGSFKGAESYRDIKNPEKIRLILTHPDSNALDIIAKVADRSKDTLQHDITELTRVAQDSKSKVKWFDGLIFNSVIIGNPNSVDAWAQVNVFVPYVGPSRRPTIEVSKQKGGEVFQTIFDAYNKIWDKSEEPELNS